MNSAISELEAILSRPPRFVPPAGLKERLVAAVPSAGRQQNSFVRRRPGGWFRRWPALAPISMSLACAAVLTIQQKELRELRASMESLSQGAAQIEAASRPAKVQPDTGLATVEEQQAEIARLKELAVRLSNEITELQRMKRENERLASQLRVPVSGMPADQAQEFDRLRDEALRTKCINNLKQIGLAVRVWSLDNSNTNPPDFLSMSNELSTPLVLLCPADAGRQAANGWSAFSVANSSYEYLAPGGSDSDPQRVLTRCPIHGSIGLCDGSVQAGSGRGGTNLAPHLVEKDGKLYFE
jgi:hypothetical protein